MLRPSALWHYYRARLRVQPLQELLALVGIATGVALIFAVQIASTSVTGTVEKLSNAVTGTATVQVVARDTRGVDEGILDGIWKVAGVQSVAPVLEQRADVRGPEGLRSVDLVGVTPALATLKGPLTQSLGESGPRLSDALLLPAPLAEAIGVDSADSAIVQSGGRSVRAPIAARLGSEQIGDFVDSPLAIAPLSYVQRVTGLDGRVTRILVAAAPGQETAVRDALEGRFGERLNVTGPDAEPQLIREAARPLDQSAGLFAAISALVGLLFAFNAMLLTIPERRRFIAELRMQGFGSGQVVSQILFEALVLGATASAVGLVLGDQLSRHIFEPIPGYLSFAFPVGGQRIVSTSSVVVAFAAGVAATLLAGIRPLGDIVSTRPIDAVSRTRGEPVEGVRGRTRGALFAAGIALLGATALTLSLAPSLTILGAGALAIALVLVLPMLLAPLVGLGWRLSDHRRGGLLMVAMSELEATPTRSVALVATAALALFGNVAIAGAHRDLLRGLDRGAHGLTHTADLWVTSDAQENTLATMPFSAPGLAQRLRRTAGIVEVRSYHGSFLDVGKRRLWVIGRPAGDRFQIPPGQVIAGEPRRAADLIRRGGWAAVSDVVAHEHGMEIGQPFRLPTPSGSRSFRLAARLTNVGWAPGTVILGAEEYRRAWSTSQPSALEIDLAPSLTAERGRRLVAEIVGPQAPLAVQTAAQRWTLLRESARQGLTRLKQISTLALISAVLALAAAMSIALWQRRPRLAELKLQGFSVEQLSIALLIETALLLACGAGLGALFGLYGQALGTRWLELVTGYPTVYEPAAPLAVAMLVAVSLVALAIAALPGWVAANVPLRLSFRGD